MDTSKHVLARTCLTPLIANSGFLCGFTMRTLDPLFPHGNSLFTSVPLLLVLCVVGSTLAASDTFSFLHILPFPIAFKAILLVLVLFPSLVFEVLASCVLTVFPEAGLCSIFSTCQMYVPHLALLSRQIVSFVIPLQLLAPHLSLLKLSARLPSFLVALCWTAVVVNGVERDERCASRPLPASTLDV